MFRYLTKLFASKVHKSQRSPSVHSGRARLTVDELAQRVLPSANPMTIRSFADAGRQAAHSAPPAGAAFGGQREAGDAGCAHGASLAATLTNAAGATGQATFNNVNGKLNIQVTGATASSSLDVLLDGESIGTVTTDASGNGKLSLTQDVAAVTVGTTIEVGDLTGTFAQTQFSASLTGATTDVSGNASYNVRENGLKVSVTGAAASTTYNVTVGGTVVGTITTNARGQAKAVFTPAVTVAAGTTIDVSATTAGSTPILSGAFA